jgi:hypothetical protein
VSLRRALILAVALVAVSASAADAAAAPQTGFLAAPTEQLAIPGPQPSGELTPEGDVYTGWAEYEPEVGAPLVPWRQPTRILPDPGVPRFVSQLTRGAVAYRETAFTVEIAGAPVVELQLSARNLGNVPAAAGAGLRVADSRGPMRPGFHGVDTGDFRFERPVPGTGDGYFFQLGAAFDPGWSYTAAGRDIDRGGLLLARGPTGPGGRVSQTAAAPTAQSIGATQAYHRRLAPGGQATWTWQLPLAPPAASSAQDLALDAVGPAAAGGRLRAFWSEQERGMTRIEVPEARIDDVYRASALAILQARYLTGSGWVQGVNRLQYQAYWLRDSSIETVALDQIGLHATAAQNLAFLPHWQQPDGLYISRPGQQDGIGQALWELRQHALLTHDPAYAAAQLPNVGAAVGWIAQVSGDDVLGLLPASTVGDDEELVGAHVTGDDVWAAVGLRSAVALATQAGRPDIAAAWQAVDTRFETSLRAAIDAAFSRTGHVPPALDQAGGFDWGNYQLSYPLPILAPASPEVRATVAWERAHSAEGLATYDGRLHDYLGFPILETELESGDAAAAVSGLYSETVHTTAPGFGWEQGLPPYGTRITALNLAPHGTFAAQYISLLRNLLVRDTGDGVDLLGGVSPAWMAASDHIAVTDAPSSAGTVSLRLVVLPGGDGATLRWRVTGRAGPVYWQLPYWVHSAHAHGRVLRGRVALPGAHGTLTLRWRARHPPVALNRAAAALDRSYRAHHRSAPLRSASGWDQPAPRAR